MDSIKETVPAIWPIFGNIGHISTTFGTNPNPFTGQSYFHTGIDCSTYRAGDLLVATGDGKVIFAGVEGGYGRCVVIAHAYGYMTRYGHMDRIIVHSGQTVKQGQGIGILGKLRRLDGPAYPLRSHNGPALPRSDRLPLVGRPLLPHHYGRRFQ